jgi:type IV secretion system protein VirB2/type IV secretion system protein PtlA
MENFKKHGVSVFMMIAFLCLFVVEPAFAQGGLDKVNTFAQNIQSILTGVSITVVTIAIMWAGYKFLFAHAQLGEIIKIVAGGLLIGGASALAGYLLG